MSEDRRSRSRSRSPDGGGGGRHGDNDDDDHHHHNNNSHHGGGGGGENYANGGNDGGGGENGEEEVKLYVGNLDYSKSYTSWDAPLLPLPSTLSLSLFVSVCFSNFVSSHPLLSRQSFINSIYLKTATDEPRLREVFGAYGTVTDVFLPMERGTSRPRGFGFVTFSTRAAAEDAAAKMDQSQLDGRTVRVNESKPRGEGPADYGGSRGGGGAGGGRGGGGGPGLGPGGTGTFNPQGRDEVKLYVGNLSFETTEENVRSMFEQYGTVTDCFLPTDRDTNRVRGFAFVTMPASEAENACNKVNGLELDGRTLRVNEAQPKGE